MAQNYHISHVGIHDPSWSLSGLFGRRWRKSTCDRMSEGWRLRRRDRSPRFHARAAHETPLDRTRDGRSRRRVANLDFAACVDRRDRNDDLAVCQGSARERRAGRTIERSPIGWRRERGVWLRRLSPPRSLEHDGVRLGKVRVGPKTGSRRFR